MKHLPLALFIIQFSKMIIFKDMSYIDSLNLFILGSMAAFYEFKSQDKQFKELKASLDEINKNHLKLDKELGEFKTHVATQQLVKQYKFNQK